MLRFGVRSRVCTRMRAAFPDVKNVHAQVHVYGQVCACLHVHVKVMFLNVRLTQTFRRQPCVARGFGDYRSHKLLDLSSIRTQVESVPTQPIRCI